ncbi:putative aquaglyceroporin [Melampsora americana]|nr:putative aquaglyceroporin [Melampsora americana]
MLRTSIMPDINITPEVSDSKLEMNAYLRWKLRLRPYVAEFLGSTLMLTIGTGVCSQVTLDMDEAISSTLKGNYLSISLGWGTAVMLGVYLSGGISGGHLNPAVTLSLAVFRGFPWKRVLPYIIAQILGAFTGSVIVQLAYAEALDLYEGGKGIRTTQGPRSTAGLFVTTPEPYMTAGACFYQEFLDTAILLIMVFALGDRKNIPTPSGINPLIFMWVIFAIGVSLGSQTGYAMNPARDFGPRLMTWIFGYGSSVWTDGNYYWFWTPWLATCSGAVFGGFLYDFLLYDGEDSLFNHFPTTSPPHLTYPTTPSHLTYPETPSTAICSLMDKTSSTSSCRTMVELCCGKTPVDSNFKLKLQPAK